jgi:hypothetical protein
MHPESEMPGINDLGTGMRSTGIEKRKKNNHNEQKTLELLRCKKSILTQMKVRVGHKNRPGTIKT